MFPINTIFDYFTRERENCNKERSKVLNGVERKKQKSFLFHFPLDKLFKRFKDSKRREREKL